ncbi:MAG: GNAT family N-acetyltransferase [Anaerolineae bacterium]|jgi:predicted GNAT family acetyltransferase|nr:GNAT family N-acetyltransferase [Anaerolineae bacterium]
MIIRSYRHSANFLARIQPVLEENEVANSLMLGLALRQVQHEKPDGTLFRSVHDELGVIAVSMQTPGRSVIIYAHRPDVTDAFAMIVADYFQNRRDPLGVVGPKSIALRFAQLWQVVSGEEPHIFQNQRLYQCKAVTNFDLTPGKLRKAYKKEVPMLIDWSMDFSKATAENPTEAQIEQSLQDDIEEGNLFVWTDGTQAVSMLKKNRPTTNTIAISFVYTPSELRGRGYATAGVHTLTAQLLKEGYQACTLYTDLNNPTSNHIYQRIGYQPVLEFDHYHFLPPTK